MRHEAQSPEKKVAIPSMGEALFEFIMLNADTPKPDEVVHEIDGLKIFPVNLAVPVIIKVAIKYHEPKIWKGG